MALFYILLMIVLVIFTASFILAVVGTIKSQYSNFNIPPGVNHPGKLRIVLAFVITTSALTFLPDGVSVGCVGLPTQVHDAKATQLAQVRSLTGNRHGSIFYASSLENTKPEQLVEAKILEKIGMCSQLAFARYVDSVRKLGSNPHLSLWDTRFGRVLVRVYRPRAPSAGLRAGAIFFHGSGWLYCSIDSHEKICRYIARDSESVVVSVE